MQEGRGRRLLDPSPGLFTAVVVVGSVVLLCALAAGSSAFRTGTNAHTVVHVSAAGAIFTAAGSVAVGIAVACSLRTILSMMPAFAGNPEPTRLSRILWGLAATALAFFLIASVAPSLLGTTDDAPQRISVASAADLDDPDQPESAASVDGWIMPVGFGVGVLAAGALMIGLRTRSRTREPIEPVEELASSVRPHAVDASLDAVNAEPDPRRAVILAYMRMEATLTAQGVPRASWETPGEYLARVFADLGPPAAAAATLTELYEEAHFADHQVAEEMRQRALESLLELRDALGVAA